MGYSRKSVREVLTDRDVMVVRASREAREAEARVAELSAELERAGRDAAEQKSRIRDLEAKLEEATERFRAVERSESPSTTEGLTDVLHAAERALARLTEAARRNAEHELGETERVHEELRAEIDDLTTWRDRVVPLIEGVRRAIEDAGGQVTSIGDRLREVVIPAMSSLDALAGRLSELAEASASPPGAAAHEEASVIRLEDADRAEREEAPNGETGALPGPTWAANRRPG
jgi:chromosome segregation ATPase